MLRMQTEESDYFRVIISEDNNFDASKGNILEIIIEAQMRDVVGLGGWPQRS
jgi:hypothetical protein